MPKLSAVITSFNNEKTISQCIKSLSFADEIIVLDSFSTDKTIEIVKQYKCTLHQQNFKGFSQQKQDAINMAIYDWVLLLDSDEYLSKDAQKKLYEWKISEPKADAYQLPRQEWVFWQWSHKWVKMNKFIRLFDKSKAKMNGNSVHESIVSSGIYVTLNAKIKHFGETTLSKKIEKINLYSELAAHEKFKQGKKVLPIKLLFYPMAYFIKQYFFRRQIFNGWAGLINATLNSRYAYLKYAKLYEIQRNNRIK